MATLSMWAKLFTFAESASEVELCRLDFPNKSGKLETVVVIILTNNSCLRALEQKHMRALRTCQPSPGLFAFVSACDNGGKVLLPTKSTSASDGLPTARQMSNETRCKAASIVEKDSAIRLIDSILISGLHKKFPDSAYWNEGYSGEILLSNASRIALVILEAFHIYQWMPPTAAFIYFLVYSPRHAMMERHIHIISICDEAVTLQIQPASIKRKLFCLSHSFYGVCSVPEKFPDL